MFYEQQEEDTIIAQKHDITVFYGSQSDIITISEHMSQGNNVMLTSEEAIAAARAILRHFGECDK